MDEDLNFIHIYLLLVGSYHVLPLWFTVESLALGQPYDCLCDTEVTLNDMGKMNQKRTVSRSVK